MKPSRKTSAPSLRLALTRYPDTLLVVDADGGDGCVGSPFGHPVAGIGLWFDAVPASAEAAVTNPALAFSALVLVMSQSWASVTCVQPERSSCFA